MGMPTAPDVDLSTSSIREMREKLGELAQMSLAKSRVAVFVVREDGVLTLLPPKVLCEVQAEDLALHLLDSWGEDQIEEFLIHLEHMRAAP